MLYPWHPHAHLHASTCVPACTSGALGLLGSVFGVKVHFSATVRARLMILDQHLLVDETI